MSRYRFFLVILVTLFLGACGANKSESKLLGLEGLTPTQTANVTDGVNSFNALVGRKVVDASYEGYPISIVIKTQAELNDIEPRMALRYGYAEMTSTGCTVSLSNAILENAGNEIGKAVVLHELGHCMGLTHEAAVLEVMSPVVYSFKKYSGQALTRFASHVRQNLWLEARDSKGSK